MRFTSSPVRGSGSAASCWRTRAVAAVEHGRASEDCREDAAADPAPLVRRDRVAMIERLRVDFVSASGSQITRSASCPTAIVPFLPPRPARRARGRRPASRRGARAEVPRSARAGPDSRQPELQRGDAAPGRHEVAVVEVLQRGRRGRVIGRDKVDLAGGRAPATERSRLARSRMGGAHLNAVAPSAISSAANVR